MARKNLLAILSIILAVAAPLLMAVKAQHDQKAYPVVKIEIEPYDPRDMFYGHYMMYQFKWNWKDGKANEDTCKGEACCLCVGAGAVDPEVSMAVCTPDKPKACAHMLKGSYYGGDRFDIGINRYYVDEKIALPLENLFRNEKERFRVGLSISPSGKTILEKLYVGDRAVNDYVADHYEKLTNPSAPQDATP
jgi:uncharacterized membrane-anchored protein